jgi:hypothetical protein
MVAEARAILKAYRRGAEWNIVKYVIEVESSITFLHYPNFDTEAHPELGVTWRVNPAESNNVHETHLEGYIIHRKELMVGEDYPGYDHWARLTLMEEAYGLLKDPHNKRIGRKTYWDALLYDNGLEISDGIDAVLWSFHTGELA